MLAALVSTQTIGIVAGIFTATSLVPQFLKILKEKKAEDISIPMLVILMVGLGIWVYYGTLKEDLPIILTNCFSLLVNIGIIVLKLKYK